MDLRNISGVDRIASARHSHAWLPVLGCSLLLATAGCHHPTRTAYQPPPPAHTNSATQGFDDTHGRPVFTETGIASWYGPGFHHHAAADGTTFDQNAMTAAHRTLPMGSLVRVTNLVTNQTVVVRITDRGYLFKGRILDLSYGAAQRLAMTKPGLAEVQLEVLSLGKPHHDN